MINFLGLCSSSINGKSTRIDVMQEYGGESGIGSLLAVILTSDLTPNYVHFFHSYCHQPVAY